jgi:pilus assembly protein Flp/PilA
VKRRLLNADTGSTATEYALIVTLIAIVVIAAVLLLGQNVLGLFDKSATIIPT